MLRSRWILGTFLSLGASFSAGAAIAAEGGFSVYGLGGAAFNAGITPPPGVYVTGVSGYYSGRINRSATVGGVPVHAGAAVSVLQEGTNVLFVPQTKLLNGQLGLSLTLPVGFVDLSANLGAGGPGIRREVQGPGLGDIVAKGQLGWASGRVFNTAYAEIVLPTGTYAPGFNANLGLHRPAIDLGWGFTWVEPTSKLQFDATAGFTFNLENTATQYQSGTEFHLEWAVGKDLGNGWTLGLVGYDYRQLTGDSGPGATLGAFEGSVDAIGTGVSYSTVVDQHPATFSVRYYKEFNAVNRFDGSSTLATATFAF